MLIISFNGLLVSARGELGANITKIIYNGSEENISKIDKFFEDISVTVEITLTSSNQTLNRELQLETQLEMDDRCYWNIDPSSAEWQHFNCDVKITYISSISKKTTITLNGKIPTLKEDKNGKVEFNKTLIKIKPMDNSPEILNTKIRVTNEFIENLREKITNMRKNITKVNKSEDRDSHLEILNNSEKLLEEGYVGKSSMLIEYLSRHPLENTQDKSPIERIFEFINKNIILILFIVLLPIIVVLGYYSYYKVPDRINSYIGVIEDICKNDIISKQKFSELVMSMKLFKKYKMEKDLDLLSWLLVGLIIIEISVVIIIFIYMF